MSVHKATLTDRIGPNAIIQVIESLSAHIGPHGAEAFFSRNGFGKYIESRPQQMVSEHEVAVLQMALRQQLGIEVAKAVSWEAGDRTGRYLLAHRIPKLVQLVLRYMPAQVAAHVLAKAIAQHAWTFVGSGKFQVLKGRPFVFSIQKNPLCSQFQSNAPACDFYSATFETLFRAIVHPRASVIEIECESMGAPACLFEIRW